MKAELTNTLKAGFATRRDAELTIERLVQEYRRDRDGIGAAPLVWCGKCHTHKIESRRMRALRWKLAVGELRPFEEVQPMPHPHSLRVVETGVYDRIVEMGCG